MIGIPGTVKAETCSVHRVVWPTERFRSNMVDVLARNWWALLIRGIAAVVFGVLAFAWPGATIVAIVILFGAYAFVDGVFAIVAAVRAAQSHERWWPFLLEGIVGFAIAAITFFEPHVTAFALYFTIAAWAFITGILEIAAAIQLRKQLRTNGCSFWPASARCSSAS